MNLAEFQAEQREWQERNFPGNAGHSALLGLVEEVGELSHAHLKTEQGIRGTVEEHRAEAEDAIGDIMVYLAGYCNNNGYDLDGCLKRAWDEVKKRDWQKNSKDGVSEEQIDAAIAAIESGNTEGIPNLHVLEVMPPTQVHDSVVLDVPKDILNNPTALEENITRQMREAGLLDEDGHR